MTRLAPFKGFFHTFALFSLTFIHYPYEDNRKV